MDLKPRPLLIFAALIVSGCASPIPQAIRQAETGDLALAEARAALHTADHRPVRWGGELIAVHNAGGHSDLEILGRPLDDKGRPASQSPSQGRFMARIEGFVDPADLTAGTEVTVRGHIIGQAELSIGEYRYRYPVVAVAHWHRWAERVQAVPIWRHDPWFYDPWYPFGPWYRYRY